MVHGLNTCHSIAAINHPVPSPPIVVCIGQQKSNLSISVHLSFPDLGGVFISGMINLLLEQLMLKGALILWRDSTTVTVLHIKRTWFDITPCTEITFLIDCCRSPLLDRC